MKFLVLVFALATSVQADFTAGQSTTAYGYLKNIGIPEGERIRRAEEEYLKNPEKIVGGGPVADGQIPYQAGLLISMVGMDGTGVCGASLISESRLITAAHCWNDGQHQAWRFTVVLGSPLLFSGGTRVDTNVVITHPNWFTVVLGSPLLFSGGTRVDTSVVVTHPNWFPLLIRNDVAVVYLPAPVALSAAIAPISLPSGDELEENFVGENVIASGFGQNADGAGISNEQSLSRVSLPIISNNICSLGFPGVVQPSNICSSGRGGRGPCGGDSGGPLALTRGDRRIVIGVVSFGSAFGCAIGLPGVYSRVSSFVDFFNQHL